MKRLRSPLELCLEWALPRLYDRVPIGYMLYVAIVNIAIVIERDHAESYLVPSLLLIGCMTFLQSFKPPDLLKKIVGQKKISGLGSKEQN